MGVVLVSTFSETRLISTAQGETAMVFKEMIPLHDDKTGEGYPGMVFFPANVEYSSLEKNIAERRIAIFTLKSGKIVELRMSPELADGVRRMGVTPRVLIETCGKQSIVPRADSDALRFVGITNFEVIEKAVRSQVKPIKYTTRRVDHLAREEFTTGTTTRLGGGSSAKTVATEVESARSRVGLGIEAPPPAYGEISRYPLGGPIPGDFPTRSGQYPPSTPPADAGSAGSSSPTGRDQPPHPSWDRSTIRPTEEQYLLSDTTARAPTSKTDCCTIL